MGQLGKLRAGWQPALQAGYQPAAGCQPAPHEKEHLHAVVELALSFLPVSPCQQFQELAGVNDLGTLVGLIKVLEVAGDDVVGTSGVRYSAKTAGETHGISRPLPTKSKTAAGTPL